MIYLKQMDSKQFFFLIIESNWVRLCLVLFDWIDDQTHSKIDVRYFCLITKVSQTIIAVQLGSISFDYIHVPWAHEQ